MRLIFIESIRLLKDVQFTLCLINK